MSSVPFVAVTKEKAGGVEGALPYIGQVNDVTFVRDLSSPTRYCFSRQFRSSMPEVSNSMSGNSEALK